MPNSCADLSIYSPDTTSGPSWSLSRKRSWNSESPVWRSAHLRSRWSDWEGTRMPRRCWTKLVSVSWEDIAFFERIERFLVEAKQFDMVASLIKILLQKYRDEENPELSLELLKKVLKYRPEDTHARRDLLNLYGVKYKDHSQFEPLMKLSKLANYKTPVKYAIQDFEKNIVFDKGNYAFHNTWKLGKIVDMDSENIIISFSGKPEQKMSVQMALQSLTPIPKDHLYVMQYEDPEYGKNLFKEEFMQFFEILIKSYGGKILLDDIKRELIPAYVSDKGWSKT